MGLKIEMQQLDPKRTIIRGKGRSYSSDVRGTALQRQRNDDRRKRKDAGRSPKSELFEHDSKDKE